MSVNIRIFGKSVAIGGGYEMSGGSPPKGPHAPTRPPQPYKKPKKPKK